MKPKETRILLIDDEEDFLIFLTELLKVVGYEVMPFSSGESALANIHSHKPHLIILDQLMPEMNGHQFCKLVRKDMLLKHLPIIMLSGKSKTEDVIGALEIGADDYVEKPFKPEYLFARIKALIYRTYRGIDANPLTILPGNNSIKEEIERRIVYEEKFAIAYLDLDNFKAINDKYGFERGDEVIKLTAKVIIDVIRDLGEENSFVGHIGGDDFIIITALEKIDNIGHEIVKRFDKIIPTVYPEEDRKRGFILSTNRQGIIQEFPIISVSIGATTTEVQAITSFVQISHITAELKEYAKKFPGSNYIIDRRGGHHLLTQPLLKIEGDSLWKGLITTDAEQNVPGFFIDELTNLPLIPLIINNIKKELETSDQIGLLCLKVSIYGGQKTYNWMEWEQILRHIGRIFQEFQGKVFRCNDLVSIYSGIKENAFIFLSPPRFQPHVTLEDLRNISERIQTHLQKRITGELGLYHAQKFNFSIGYALITNHLDLPIEKSIYYGLERAAHVTVNKEEYNRWELISNLRELINNRGVYSLFQPIVNLSVREPIGYEVLSRGTPYGYYSISDYPIKDKIKGKFEHPKLLFDLAERSNLIWTLEHLCQEKALEGILKLPLGGSGGLFFFNMAHQSISDPRFRRMELFNRVGLKVENIVIELSARTIVEEFKSVSYAVRWLRNKGVKVAIDNIEPFYIDLPAMVYLKPDFIKLDSSLVRGIDGDLLRQNLLKGFMETFQQLECTVIAVGIETEAEYNALLKMGVKYGQGYFLGSPQGVGLPIRY